MGHPFVSVDFMLAAIVVAFALFAVAMLLAQCAPISKPMNLVQRVVVSVASVAGGFVSFLAFLVSIPVAALQWEAGLLGTVLVASCVAFGLSVVQLAVLRKSAAIWFCTLEEQLHQNTAKVARRQKERLVLRDPLGHHADKPAHHGVEPMQPTGIEKKGFRKRP
jgi:hypothetical protein